MSAAAIASRASRSGEAGNEVVYVAIQRAWPKEGDTDKVNTKIGRCEIATGEWGFVHKPLQPEGDGGWFGLSGITAMPDGSFWVIERVRAGTQAPRRTPS